MTTARLLSPQAPTHTVPRPRLFERLKEGLDSRLTVLCAGGGWGKSVLLVSFLKSLDLPFVWYGLDRNDADPLGFLANLCKGMSRQYAGLGGKTLKTIALRGEGADWRFIMSTLFNEIFDSGAGRILLVFDDCHSIAGTGAMREALAHLVASAPPNVHVILSGRERPEFGPGGASACGGLVEIGREDLRFNETETGTFFRTAYGMELDAADLAVLESYTQGWAVGLRLIGAAYAGAARDERLSEFLSGPAGPRRRVFEYFAREVLAGLPGEIGSFLRETSILNRFNPALCEAVTHRADSSRIIDELLGRGLFTIAMDEDGGWYGYHHLFKDFLEDALVREKGQGFITALHGRAARYLMSAGEEEEALYHSIQAQDYDTAAGAARRRIGYTFSSSLARRLLSWIEPVPAGAMERSGGLLFAKGWANYVNGQWGRAGEYLRLAMEMAVETGDTALLGQAAYFMLAIHISKEEFAKAEELIGEIMPRLGPESPEMMHNHIYYAIALTFLNRPSEALPVWEAILGSTVAGEDRAASVTARSGMGYMYHLPLGMFRESLGNLDEGLEYTREEDRTGVRGMFLYFLSEVRHEMGFFYEVDPLAMEAVREMRRTGLVFPIPSALMLSAVNAAYNGESSRAVEAMKEAQEVLARADVRNLWRRYHEDVARAMLASGAADPEGFYRHARSALRLARENGDHFAFYQVSCWLAPHYAAHGDAETAMGLLQDSIERMISLGNPYGEARSSLLLASVLHDRAETAAAARHLRDSLTIGEEREYDFLFLRKEKAAALKLLPLAVAEGFCIPYVSGLLARLGNECSGRILALLDDPAPQVRKAAVDILSAMKYREAEKEIALRLDDADAGVREAAREAVSRLKALPPLPLRVYLLGSFRVFAGEREIERRAWRRRSARSLFKYLLLHQGRWVEAARLADVFYMDADALDASRRLHQATSSLRRALEPGISPKRESSYLKFKDGAYCLVLPEGSYVDLFEFERLHSAASSAVNAGDLYRAVSSCTTALRIYSGGLPAEDADSQWIGPVAERYRRMYISVLRDLSQCRYERLEYTLSIETSRRLLEEEPWNEDAIIMLMKSSIAVGERAGAVAAYGRYSRVLKQEFGIGPGEAVSGLYAEVAGRRES